ncbi:MAG TPA: DUF1704 domain-containing protein [Candidatus Dojkabacteria bacterium]|jgi:hypothetical protein|nr:DUF1704 domain-containing protein [Candidatus Dojkabacteria bacterium]HOR05953.1 DUF1704 domain-containing protein [Candidatus Dojkabacteria bacterium]HOT60734.1 DUF1704 domain-containing protein [Candidatus Dojkabacteria bacterium]HQI92524.1 DUF1704 domain-containing protein [Candidatus Dojkabacteria bacterium]
MNMFLRKAKKTMKVEEVTRLLGELKIPIALVFTPTNLNSEKKKFFDSDTYEPQFQYRIVKNKNEEIFKDLASVKEISDVDPRISNFYIDLIDSKREASDLMHAVGNNEAVTDISVARYGKPSAKLFRNSARVLRGRYGRYNLAKENKERDSEMLGYDSIVSVFDVVFKELGLEGWSVNKSLNIAKNGVKVGVKRKEVLVDGNISKSKFQLRKTLVHEVGTHALRSYYGLKSGFEAISKPNLASYLDVEEGLASWNENNMGLLPEKSLRNKAGLTWAIYVGEELSFRQLYNVLLGNFSKLGAFDIAYRVKRGLSDTSYPGIYAKDVVYFRGFRKVMKKLEEDPTLYQKLYSGKISFKQCEWVEDGLIPKASKIPSKNDWIDIFRKAGI